jgi:hypothetical protein
MELSSNRSLWIKEEVAYVFALLVIVWLILHSLLENGRIHPPGTNLFISETTSTNVIIIIELLYFYLLSVLIVYIYSKV